MKTVPISFMICSPLAAVLSLAPFSAAAELVETEIPNVAAEVAELRTAAGVTRLAVRYVNSGTEQAGTDRFEADQIVLVDMKSKLKHFPIKDTNNEFVAGPIGDAIGGGRVYVLLEAGQQGVAWAYFDALVPGTVVSVELPQMFPFEDVVVTEGASALFSAGEAKSIPAGALATVASARRADQALDVRLRLDAEAGAKVDLRSPYFEYKGVYLFDPAGKRKYPLMKDSEGIFQARPLGQKMGGGTFLPDWEKPILMSLTFPAPPDSVRSVDLILPDFQPFENVAIEGRGAAAGGGIAAGGKTLGLEGALEELRAAVTPEEIRIDLSADVLFDLDKADLKAAAHEKLSHLLTVVNSHTGSHVSIEGHTDLRGSDAYNQALSERRADSVRTWLVAHGVAADRITAAGAGKSRPLRTGDTEADHQANRRVEIRIRNRV